MIAFLEGEIVSFKVVDFATCVINVSGVGYIVYMPKSAANRLHLGENTRILTYQVVREDAITLYGFTDVNEHELFEQLISVSGVGPKIALAILSHLGAKSVQSAILSDDVSALSKTPGLGKKGAQKIILELRGKLVVDDTTPAVKSTHQLLDTLTGALASLGYKPTIAKDAAAKVLDANPELDETTLPLALKNALQLLAK